ncbi:MAG: hypothetical protein KJ593_03130 [Candidatus Omnitrophica bacterium]|nr:hypothetical protein [Candidatus Omnitrophota bacterium]
MLADVDGDMHWEALMTVNAVLFCSDLPFRVSKKYMPFRYRRLSGDPLEDHSGFNYDIAQSERAFH